MNFRKNMWIIIITVLAVVWITTALADGPVKPTGKERCPVCGMFTRIYPKWIAQIIFKDGSYELFDGPKDMLKYYLNMSEYTKNKTKEDIAEIFVSEYYSTKLLSVDEVFFIQGSDVLGPMGAEFVPVKGEKEAKEFMEDHGGKKMLRFEKITLQDIPGIN